jgi:hypothetical protein
MPAKLCSSVYFCVQNTKHKQEITYKNFLHKVASTWISKFQNLNELSLDELHLPGGLYRTHQADSLGILANTNWTKLLLVGGSSSIIPDSVKWTLHMRKVKQDACLNFPLFHFTKGLGLRNMTPLGTTRLSTCSFFSPGFRTLISTFKL